ncbi:MAG TPA: hypothetical protein VF201_08905 [Nitrolancea sp.]
MSRIARLLLPIPETRLELRRGIHLSNLGDGARRLQRVSNQPRRFTSTTTVDTVT